MDVFVGRERELAALSQAFQMSLQHHGSLILVSGEAGIGKTTLVRHMVAEARDNNALVLSGAAYDLSATPPYGPWVELTDRYAADHELPDLPDVLRRGSGIGDLSSQLALFEVARDFFSSVAAVQALVLVLEDLHWADQASLDLLRYLARQIDGQRILVIATYRDDQVTRRHPLFSLLPPLLRETQATRVDLNVLSRDSVRDLVTGRWELTAGDQDRLVDYLLEHAEGQPLFTVELIRTLEHGGFIQQSGDMWHLTDLSRVPVPALVRQVIEGRVAKLGDEARHFLEVAAVIGQQVPVDLWQSVTVMTDEDLLGVLHQATELHLLEEVSEQSTLKFVHALTRETLYADILLPRRRLWHRLIAETLASTANPVPDTVAYHFQQAGDPRAVDWLIRAGEWAQHAFAWRSAVDRFRAAADLLAGDDSRLRERAWLRYRTARLSLYQDPADGVADLDEAIQIAAQTGDSVLRVASLVRRGHLMTFTGNIQSGTAEMSAGVTAWDELSLEEKLSCEYMRVVGSDPYINVFRGTLLLWYGTSGRFRECLREAETFLPEMESAKERLLAERHIYWLDGYVGIAGAYSAMGDLERARELLEFARDGYARIGIPAMESLSSHVLLRYIHIPCQTERLEERHRLTVQMDDAWNRSSGGIRPEMLTRLQHVQLLSLEGGWHEVIDLARRGMHWHANSIRKLELRAAGGSVARHQGNPSIAWEHVNAALPDGPATDPGSVGFFFEALELISLAADLELDAGDHQAAHAWLVAYDRWMEWSGAVRGQADGKTLWARYCRETGDPATARAYAEDSVRLASDPRQPLTLIAAHRFLGELALVEGDHDASESHLNQSLELATACAVPFAVASTMIVFAELEQQRGSPAAAKSYLNQSRRICTNLGAEPALARVNDLLGRMKPSAGGRTATGLSQRETEVLRLLARGLSDREIAEELFISYRTVTNHVGSILRKLNVDSRTAAATQAVRRDLV